MKIQLKKNLICTHAQKLQNKKEKKNQEND